VKVAEKYLKEINKDKRRSTLDIAELRENAIEQLEKLSYEFAKVVRLDLDFENYLMPAPIRVPEITITSTGPIDVNSIALGLEYTLRFPKQFEPKSKEDAQQMIQDFAQQYSEVIGQGQSSSLTSEGHGHGIAVRYEVQDSQQQNWRVEWDGIQRSYTRAGKVKQAWGGHMEIVTPKFSPESVLPQIQRLYELGRENGMRPRRSAGGAHINFDLKFLQDLPVKKGTRALSNLISYFESNQSMVLFMWRHPKRTHSAEPILFDPRLSEKLKQDYESWDDYGTMLYEMRYFNTYVGRKPKYVPLNVTSLMTRIVPDLYLEKPIDIKNKNQQWQPNFNKVYGRGEARLFDAPVDEAMAALQIKYWRALLNHAFNAEKPLTLKPRFTMDDMQRWKNNPDQWIKDATAHLTELGLDPAEFQGLLWDSFINQQETASAKEKTVFKNFLPAKTPEKKK
jgi:hypothetical protein